MDLDFCDIKWFALEMNRVHSVIFEVTSKYWISDSFVDYDGYKRVQNAILGCNLKNDRMISVHFQGKAFNITVIQTYAPTRNAEEAEVEWFYEDLQDFLELTPKKDVFFIIGD